MSFISLKSTLLHGITYFIVLLVIIFAILPLILATVTILRQQLHSSFFHLREWNRTYRNTTAGIGNSTNIENYSSQQQPEFQSSALYVGRVWHTRFLPIKHSFTYPIFIFGLNLNEIYHTESSDTSTTTASKKETSHNDDIACRFHSMLWPLSLIVSFNPNDHLKNGEGNILNNKTLDDSSTTKVKGTTTFKRKQSQKSFPDRIFQFIEERTNGSFKPNHQTHSIFLVTHLTYYGYCFNPVSFYFIHERHTASQQLVCVIGEVSNTPWNEMHCYVLHPNSTDLVQCSCSVNDGTAATNDNSNDTTHQRHETTKYIFPKQFHVSPFMEMNYNYEWVFTNFSIQPTARNDTMNLPSGPKMITSKTTTTSIHIINNLRPITSTKSTSETMTNIPVSSSTSSSNTNSNIGDRKSVV